MKRKHGDESCGNDNDYGNNGNANNNYFDGDGDETHMKLVMRSMMISKILIMLIIIT